MPSKSLGQDPSWPDLLLFSLMIFGICGSLCLQVVSLCLMYPSVMETCPLHCLFLFTHFFLLIFLGCFSFMFSLMCPDC